MTTKTCFVFFGTVDVFRKQHYFLLLRSAMLLELPYIYLFIYFLKVYNHFHYKEHVLLKEFTLSAIYILLIRNVSHYVCFSRLVYGILSPGD